MAIAGTDNAAASQSQSEAHTSPIRRVARVGSPVTLALAFILFLLPFLSVSCDSPGGYGRMSGGGTTTYTGFDLAIGSSPTVDDEHLRPAAEQQSDDLGVQPLVAVAALLTLAAIVVPFVSARRRPLSALLAGLSAALLVIGILLARATLVDRIAEQATVPFPSGKSAGDYVRWGIGFWIVLALMVLGAAFGLIGARSEPDRSRADTP
ncbi:MAG: hypothetical protein ABI658_02660 [Acidimicrobiales bacterium]